MDALGALFVIMNEYIELVKLGDADAAAKWLDAHPELLTARDSQGASLVALACYRGQPAIARLIAERRPLDLWEACMLGDLARVQHCLESEGTDVNEAAADGFPPFALAVFFGQPEVYRYLLQHGADVNQAARNPMRVTAVHAAVARHDADGLALILEHGGDPNARQQAGWTGLHSAAAHGDRRMTEMLLRAGADRQALTEKGETAADLARSGGHNELALWLEALV